MTHETEQQNGKMSRPERIKRPVPERTKPKRNVLGALGQADGMLGAAASIDTPQNGGHPLGPGFNDAAPPPSEEAIMGRENLGLIDEGVRAASELVDAHIRQGEETAKALGKSASIPLTQTDVSGLLTGLVRAYSDAASIWVDLVGSLAQKVEGVAQGRPAQPQAASIQAGFGLSIASEGRVETGFEMFRAADDVLPQPLVISDGSAAPQISDIRYEHGAAGKVGRISVSVPTGQPAGTYHGLLLSAADQSPVGVLTLRVVGNGTAEAAN